MSDTPEADKQWAEFLNKLEKPIDVFVDFARKLERERDEAERENEQLLASNKTYERDWPILVQERDDLQDQRDLSIRMAKERERQRDEIAALVRRLFQLLETVEVSDSEREFYPTRIQSCRVMHTIELGELLPKLKEAVK